MADAMRHDERGTCLRSMPSPSAGGRLTGVTGLGRKSERGSVRRDLTRTLARGSADLARAQGVLPAWLRPTEAENRLPVVAAILVAAAVQYALPEKYGLRPRWVLPALELILLAALTVLNPARLTRRTPFENMRRCYWWR